MHPVYLLSASFVPLGIMIVSDFRKRQIGIVWLCTFALLLFGTAWLQSGGETVVFRVKFNLVFLAGLYLALGLYIHVFRQRKYASLFQAIGLGDLLFLPVLSPFFGIRDFVLFLTVSFLLTLAEWGFLRWAGRAPRTVPLVGTVGICFVLFASIRFFL